MTEQPGHIPAVPAAAATDLHLVGPPSSVRINTAWTLAVRPGRSMTGMVMRHGTRAVTGATAGLLRDDGRGLLELRNDTDEATLFAYTDRVADLVYELWENRPEPNNPAWRLLVAAPRIPVHVRKADAPDNYARARARRGYVHRVPLTDWLVPWGICSALRGMYRATTLVVCQHQLGNRHSTKAGGNGKAADYYPPELHGRRPNGWARNDHPKAVRGPEQAAYDLAAALDMPGAHPITR